MAECVVKVVLDTDSLVEFMARVHAAADVTPMQDDETPVDWMRRVIDAACWLPEGWSDPEATSPASGEEG